MAVAIEGLFTGMKLDQQTNPSGNIRPQHQSMNINKHKAVVNEGLCMGPMAAAIERLLARSELAL